MQYRYLILPLAVLLFYNLSLDDTPRSVWNSNSSLRWGGEHVKGSLLTGLVNTLLVNIIMVTYSIIPLLIYSRLSNADKSFLAKNLLMILIFTNFSILMTYPLILHLDSSIPGRIDTWEMRWNIWWVKESVLGLKNPFHTDLLYGKNGKNLIFHANILFLSLLSIPIQLLLSLNIAYNILNLQAFIFAGYGMYLLVKHLTKHDDASFIAGILFAFTPFHFARLLGHLNMLSTQWILFYILFFLKTIEGKKWINPFLAAFFFAATAYTFLFQTVIVAIITLIIATERILENNRAWSKTLIFFLTCIILTIPLIIELAGNYNSRIKPGSSADTIFYSADILGYTTPPPINQITGSYFKGVSSRFSGNITENTIYLGLITLIMSAYAIINIKFKTTGRWILLILIFFILSLGPLLHIGGIVTVYNRPVVDSDFTGDVKIHSKPVYHIESFLWNLKNGPDSFSPTSDYSYISLPYLWISDLPFMRLSRTPVRFALGVIIGIVVLAGLGLKLFFERNKNPWLPSLIVLIILLDHLVVPFPLSSVNPSFEIYEKLGSLQGEFIIHEEPYSNFFISQPVHGKKILSGYPKAETLGKQMMYRDIVNMSRYSSINEFFRDNEVSFFIVHKNMTSISRLNYITANINAEVFYEDEYTITYSIRRM